MHNDTAFLNSIPKFLRRPEERMVPGRAIAFRARPTAGPTAVPRAVLAIHGGLPPVQPNLSAEPRPVLAPAPSMPAPNRGATLPWLARRVSDIRAPAVVDLTKRRDASVLAEAAAHRMQSAARQAFDAQTETETGDDDDAAFQVTLPRSVIRQIRMVAAAEGTTHRAIVLRALRATGLEIPDGADVDRRAGAAKRRQQG